MLSNRKHCFTRVAIDYMNRVQCTVFIFNNKRGAVVHWFLSVCVSPHAFSDSLRPFYYERHKHKACLRRDRLVITVTEEVVVLWSGLTHKIYTATHSTCWMIGEERNIYNVKTETSKAAHNRFQDPDEDLSSLVFSVFHFLTIVSCQSKEIKG